MCISDLSTEIIKNAARTGLDVVVVVVKSVMSNSTWRSFCLLSNTGQTPSFLMTFFGDTFKYVLVFFFLIYYIKI